MAIFNDLPTELVVQIGVFLDEDILDLAAFALTNRKSYMAVNPLLYEASIRNQRAYCLFWAAKNGLLRPLRFALATDIHPDVEWWGMTSEEDLRNRGQSTRAQTRKSPEAIQSQSFWSRFSISPSSRPSSPDMLWLDSTDDNQSPRRSPKSLPDLMPSVASALHYAAMGGHTNVVEALLDSGASIDIKSDHICGCVQMRPALYRRSVEDDRVLRPSWTPLHVAICHRQESTAKLLLSRGASVTMGWSHFFSNSPSQNSTVRAIHIAAGTGQVELAKHLMNEGYEADINVQDSRGYSPLHYAIANGHWDDMVPWLLSNGVSIDTPMLDVPAFFPEEHAHPPSSPLIDACRNDRFDEAIRLVELGANVEARDPVYGRTPAHYVCALPLRTRKYPSMQRHPIEPFGDEGRLGIEDYLLELLISKCPQVVHAVDDMQMTPLHYASELQLVNAIRLLLSAGADPNQKDQNSLTPLMAACMGEGRDNEYYPAEAVGRFGRGDYWVTHRVYHGNFLTTLSLLLENGADPNQKSDLQDTTLCLLCENDQIGETERKDAITKLIEAGADLNYAPRGASVLSLLFDRQCSGVKSVREGLELAKFLFQHGARLFTHEFLSLFENWAYPKRYDSRYATPDTGHAVFSFLLHIDSNQTILGNWDLIYHYLTNDPETRLAEVLYPQIPSRLWTLHHPVLLHIACTHGSASMVRSALNAGADPNLIDINSQLSVPLCLVMHKPGREQAVRVLLSCGACVHSVPFPTTTTTAEQQQAQVEAVALPRPMEAAIRSGQLAYVRMLLEHSPLVSPLVRDRRVFGGYLHTAVDMLRESYKTRILEELLRAEADASVVNGEGETPLSAFLLMLDRARPRPFWLTTITSAPERLVRPMRLLWSRGFAEADRKKVLDCVQGFLWYEGRDRTMLAVRTVLRKEMNVEWGEPVDSIAVQRWFLVVYTPTLPPRASGGADVAPLSL